MSGNFFVAGGAAYSSEKTTWRTPKSFFDKLNDRFGPFTLDAAASDGNALCDSYFTEQTDGLLRDWSGSVFCNPPYDRNLGNWLEHAYSQRNRCDVIVMLVPARTDTGYWCEWVYGHADEILFVEGRLSFSDIKTSAAFGSAVVIYRPDSIKTNYGTIER